MPGPRVILDMSKLLEIERQIPGRAERVVQKLAQDTEKLIGVSWNPQSPSPEGETPGVDTGALKASIKAEPGDERLTWVVHDGVEYGVYLEYGTENEDGSIRMAARPWLLPAVEQVAANVPDGLLREVVE